MIRFQIPDMTCKHCERAVTEAVQQVEPGVGVKIDLEHHWLTIDSSGDPSAFALMLTEAGYAPIAVGS